MSHNTLENYFHLLFALKEHRKWSISEIEEMIPFERDIMVQLLTDYLENLREQAKMAQQQ
jgi:hypothetical protein